MSTLSTAGEASSSNTVPMSAIPASRIIPADKIRLDMLLLTGQRAYWDFTPSERIGDVKKRVWQEWPSDWPARPSAPAALRMLYLGSFLDDQVLLGSSEDETSGSPSLPPKPETPPPAELHDPSVPSRNRKTLKPKAEANSSLAANKDSIAARNFPTGKRTVIHVVVQGGFTDPSTSAGADATVTVREVEDKSTTNAASSSPKPATTGTRSGNRNASDTNEAGSCCCVIC